MIMRQDLKLKVAPFFYIISKWINIHPFYADSSCVYMMSEWEYNSEEK